MPRVKLASWYGDHAPGEELDVDDVALKALRRDGLVAEVVTAPEPVPEPTAGQESSSQSETGRRRR